MGTKLVVLMAQGDKILQPVLSTLGSKNDMVMFHGRIATDNAPLISFIHQHAKLSVGLVTQSKWLMPSHFYHSLIILAFSPGVRASIPRFSASEISSSISRPICRVS